LLGSGGERRGVRGVSRRPESDGVMSGGDAPFGAGPEWPSALTTISATTVTGWVKGQQRSNRECLAQCLAPTMP
jgi:hypothetical protein